MAVDSIATTVFAISGVWLAGLGIDAVIVSSGDGAGKWLSAAPAALIAGLVFGLRLVRDVTPAALLPAIDREHLPERLSRRERREMDRCGAGRWGEPYRSRS